MNIADLMADSPIVAADLSRFVSVAAGASVTSVVESMNQDGHVVAFVMDGRRLAGIFTDRDVMVRVAANRATWEAPVDDLMSRDVRTLPDTASVADGLDAMTEHWIRNVPVVTSAGEVVGNFSAGAVLEVTSTLLGREPVEEESEPSVQHGLEFIDLTALTSRKPVMVVAATTVGDAIHQMVTRGIGSVLVVDERESPVGVFTESDIQFKLACRDIDFDAAPVSKYMTSPVVTMSPRMPIAAAIRTMAEREFNHLPLVGESGRAVAVVSARDLADYLMTSLTALG